MWGHVVNGFIFTPTLTLPRLTVYSLRFTVNCQLSTISRERIKEGGKNLCYLLSRYVVFTLILLGCAASLSGEAVATPPESPTKSGSSRIVFAEPVYDFGTVEQGDLVTHPFKFTNQGQGDLRIEQVKTSCGCTAAVTSSKVIPPGGEGAISATFDTSRFFGKKARTISVYSNDPIQPLTTLTLQGEITVEVAAVPPQLYLGRVRKGQKITKEVEVLYDAKKALDITKVENTHPAVSVQVEELEKDGKKGKRLVVTLTEGVSLGRLNDQITVTTTSEKRPTLTIPIFGSIEGDLLVLPPQVSFGVLRKGETKVKEVNIQNRGPNPVKILRVQPPSTDITTELTTVREGEEYRLAVRLKGASATGRIQGEVQVYTDHPEERMLTIPLYGIVTDSRRASR